MKMKWIIPALFAFPFAEHAIATGIAVYDVMTYAQVLATVTQLKQEYAQLQSMQSNLTGSRSMSGLLMQNQLNSNLPTNSNLYSSSSTNSTINSYESSITANEAVSSDPNSDLAALNTRKKNLAYQSKAMYQAAYDNAIQRLDNIEALAKQIDTTDAKASVDLTNRLKVEEMLLTSEMQRIQLMQALNNAELNTIQTHSDAAMTKITDASISSGALFN